MTVHRCCFYELGRTQLDWEHEKRYLDPLCSRKNHWLDHWYGSY
ncbi:hypothetical protein SLEP1_g41919 [Rubroshorea leprosula]|uniref:Uncharacterized protein n=1 Tax=Rubroshorea leprosula TaxID=152421 RepID=A0AAV5L835_9ROSI|nr:hypothetical protein SLEP1_g41919 [Rubroshorea leprosula]